MFRHPLGMEQNELRDKLLKQTHTDLTLERSNIPIKASPRIRILRLKHIILLFPKNKFLFSDNFLGKEVIKV